MNKAGARIDVTMIGTLPPVKGISPYCAELTSMLGERVKVEFLDFKRLYPERFYPGKTEEDDLYPIYIEKSNISRRRILDICNPFTWLKAGFTARGRIVHAQWWSGILFPVYLVILVIARLRKKKVIITVHNVDPHEGSFLLRFLNRSILPLGNEFIVHGDTGKAKLQSRVGAKKKVHVVPHPPFNSALGGDDCGIDKTLVRNELGVDDLKPLLIFFGNIRGYKGLDVLLRAMPMVREANPEARLLVTGQLWEDWGRYEHIIREEGIGQQLITRLEHQPFSDLKKFIVSSDLAVFPFTHLDSASGSVILARSLGKPIVASDIGDMRDLDGLGVWLAEPGSPNSLAEAINEALRYSGENKEGRSIGDEISPDMASREIVEKHMLIYKGLA
jgi:glycosyltransferase involved in cell wall biosynthesis